MFDHGGPPTTAKIDDGRRHRDDTNWYERNPISGRSLSFKGGVNLWRTGTQKDRQPLLKKSCFLRRGDIAHICSWFGLVCL